MLTSLHRIIREVGGASDLDDALRAVVHGVRAALRVDVCSLYLRNEKNFLVLMATEGLLPDSVGHIRLAVGEGLVGLVAEREEPINLDDAPAHADFKFFPAAGEELFHAFLGVPIIHQRRLAGVLVVQQRPARRFRDSHVAFLVTLAAQLAGIIAFAKAAINQGVLAKSVVGDRFLEGIAAAPGVAMGTAVVIAPEARLEAVADRKIDDAAGEVTRFHSAVDQVLKELRSFGDSLRGTVLDADRALFDAYGMMLDGGSIVEDSVRRIRAGNWAPGALRETIEQHAGIFDQMNDPYLRERASDVRGLGRRILMRLEAQDVSPPEYPHHSVLISEEFTAADLAEVPQGRLAGVVSGRGSTLSHVAILARTLGVPVVMGLGDVPLSHLHGKKLVVDGYKGRVYIEPRPEMNREFHRLVREEKDLAEHLKAFKKLPAETPDGWRLPLYINSGMLEGIAPSLNAGVDGVGLFRTEIAFIVRDQFPTEDEQFAIYRHILKSFAPRPVTLRTLDAGGDKALPYFPVEESNPFLGWRGLRMTLDHPEILLVQLRAAIRASEGLDNLRLLLPMVTTAYEVEEALRLIGQAREELEEEGITVALTVGIMIEVPAAAIEVERLARRVDFLSIGTNDLIQYLLAVDRGNERVARLFEPLHPAVLKTIKAVVDGGHRAGKPVGVCGESAGDPFMALLLLGMDIDNLSLGLADVPRIKWLVRSFTRDKARELVDCALKQEHAKDIRKILGKALKQAGLEGLIKAGV